MFTSWWQLVTENAANRVAETQTHSSRTQHITNSTLQRTASLTAATCGTLTQNETVLQRSRRRCPATDASWRSSGATLTYRPDIDTCADPGGFVTETGALVKKILRWTPFSSLFSIQFVSMVFFPRHKYAIRRRVLRWIWTTFCIPLKIGCIFRWDVSVICLARFLQLAVTVFTSLPLRWLWPIRYLTETRTRRSVRLSTAINSYGKLGRNKNF